METRKLSAAEQKALLAREEGHFLDLKSSRIAPAGLQKHFVAFANTDGGELYVGIEDEKVKGQRIIGFPKPEAANDVVQLLLTSTKPSVEGVDLELLDCGAQGLILHVVVPKSPQVHYTAADECHVRVNASTKRITGDAITRLAYAKGSYNYERVPIPDTELEYDGLPIPGLCTWMLPLQNLYQLDE